ncbi:MAG: transposase [Paludibacter sp.]|nr:transposase [Paludibacter sp.]
MKIKLSIIFFTLLIWSLLAIGQVRIKMQKEGGVYKIPCIVNGLKLNFIFDTGASILKHIDGVINAALYQLTNARAESINAKIQIVKSTARGFKNFIGYRTSLMFFLGRLDMLSY